MTRYIRPVTSTDGEVRLGDTSTMLAGDGSTMPIICVNWSLSLTENEREEWGHECLWWGLPQRQ